ncbi:MAG TPA: NADH-ubiquinone oxidoreductase-F iron-sulfur binding region domain-containing protein, partial [Kineosporiaceae bacterium]|nr:NADH-ubiquinone oxidoreductase-F iron-sulfur binding region domain-containing protein [Kineosporiaceae bacterium]
EPMDTGELVARTQAAGLRGRGGAGFPFSRKLSTAAESGRRRTVIVNASEGEPGSAKDSALMITSPHLVLDGAELVAGALESPTVKVVIPPERTAVGAALRAAIAERPGDLVRYEMQETGGSFVGGQARAVIELAEGRDNLPVTSWSPEAVNGIKGRPTLLSNAETYAQVAAVAALGVREYLRAGTADEPGTTLLTVAGDGPGGVVLEVPFGAQLADVLVHCGYAPDGTVLMGGYHGTWMTPAHVSRRRISRADLAAAGANIGAGVVLPLDPASCPVEVTARIVEYLAAHSARRCGPCKNGLPALADSLDELSRAGDAVLTGRVKELVAIVTGRGACAHPDGTAGLVRSLFTAFPDEVRVHEAGRCTVAAAGLVRR